MKRLLLLALTLFLSSCFDVREEITVSADGSGRLRFDYTMPKESLLLIGGEQGIRDEIDKLLSDEPRVRLEKLDVTIEGGDTHLHIDIRAESMLALMDLQKTQAYQDLPASSRQLAGSFDVRLDGLNVRVERRMDIAKALGFATLGIGREDRETRTLEYIIHLPKPASDHNADLKEDGGRTLIWRRSLAEAMKGPFETRFTAPIPLPAWLIPAVVLILMLIVLGILSLARRLRRRRD